MDVVGTRCQGFGDQRKQLGPARRRWGTASAKALARLGPRVETVPRRVRWFAFRGDLFRLRGLVAVIVIVRSLMSSP